MHKTIKIFTVILLALILILFISNRERSRVGIIESDIRSIEIKAFDGNSIRIEKEAGGWRINGRAADAGIVELALSSLRNMDLSDVISYREEKYPDFGVDPARARRVLINEEVELFIGNRAPDWMSSYLRYLTPPEGDSSPVYIAGGIMRELFPSGRNEWLEKQVFSFSEPLIKIRLETEEEEYEILPENEVFNDIQERISGVEATGFPDSEEALNDPFNLRLISEDSEAGYLIEIKEDGASLIRKVSEGSLYETPASEIIGFIEVIKNN